MGGFFVGVIFLFTFEQAKNFSEALLKFDPEAGGVIKESAKSVVEGVLPHKG